MIRCFVLLLYASESLTFGYDSGGGDQAACGRPYRSGRVYQPPCDLRRQGYCTSAGARYPWHAVKRFVRDNKGLMRRMYGDQRHGHVLRDELEEELDIYDPLYDWHPPPSRSRFSRYQRYEEDDIDNELVPNEDPDDNDDDEEIFIEEGRYLRDDLPNVDLLNTKFVYSEEPAVSIKLAGLKTAPHFRPTMATTRRTTTVKPKITTSKEVVSTSLKQIKTTVLKPLKTTTTAAEEDITTPVPFTTTTAPSTTTFPANNTTTVTSNLTTILITSTPIISSTSPTTTTPTTATILNSEDFTTETTTEETTTAKRQVTTAAKKQTTTTSKIHVTTTTVQQPTPDTSSLNLNVASDRLGEDDGDSENASDGNNLSDGSDVSEISGGGLEGTIEKVETMLFQDMVEEDSSKKKVHVHHKLRGVNACPVKEEVVAPFWANNTRGEVLALLNMYPFEQYVHWEKCTFEHRQMYCREGCRCEQQYRLHRLLAYDPSNECRGIFSDWFRFPSCCVCKCYDVPPEFRVTSRSPRFQQNFLEP